MTERKVIKNNPEDGGGSTFAESFLSNSQIHPSYTGLLKLPYDVICRQRLTRKKRKFAAQFNRELNHMIAMKRRAVDGIRLDLLFSDDN